MAHATFTLAITCSILVKWTEDLDPVYVTIEDDELIKADSDSDSDSNTEVSIPNYWQSGIFTKNNKLMVHKIEEGTSGYVNVKNSFTNGMRNFGKHAHVIGIHRKNYEWSVIDEARVEAFRIFAAAVASWYGDSREEIREILCYGFRQIENCWVLICGLGFLYTQGGESLELNGKPIYIISMLKARVKLPR
ncbi:hypothetical protein LXL04_006213 [Taraxacum kok-saghyz]